MLKFFRNIRQNLLLEGKTGKYLKYAIGEIVLVVIGILIALQINNWNEERKLKVTTNAYVERLINDLVADTIAIHEGLSIRRKSIAIIEAYFENFNTTKMSLKSAIDDAVNVQSAGLYRYIPVNQTYEDLKSTGNLNLLNQDQQKILSQLASQQEFTQLGEERLWTTFIEQANLASNYLERRRMVMANQNTALLKNSKATFKSVYEVLGLKEDPERMAQGLIHQQNYLLAMLIYHNVSVDWNLKIIELSKDAIQILQSEK